jgi:hypothetical protein
MIRIVYRASVIFIFILTLLAFAACSGSDSGSGAKSNESIVGNWVWYETTGGIAGVHETPENTGETRKVVFEDNGNITFYTNGEVTQSSTYTLAIEKTMMSEDPLPVVKVEGTSFIYIYSFPYVDELNLVENVTDGFEYKYKKE